MSFRYCEHEENKGSAHLSVTHRYANLEKALMFGARGVFNIRLASGSAGVAELPGENAKRE